MLGLYLLRCCRRSDRQSEVAAPASRTISLPALSWSHEVRTCELHGLGVSGSGHGVRKKPGEFADSNRAPGGVAFDGLPRPCPCRRVPRRARNVSRQVRFDTKPGLGISGRLSPVRRTNRCVGDLVNCSVGRTARCVSVTGMLPRALPGATATGPSYTQTSPPSGSSVRRHRTLQGPLQRHRRRGLGRLAVHGRPARHRRRPHPRHRHRGSPPPPAPCCW